jgi:hypothetical protein
MTEEEILLTGLTEKQQNIIMLLTWGAKKRKVVLNSIHALCDGATLEDIVNIENAIIKSREDSTKRSQGLYR